MQKFNISGYPV